jgi:hypothetical protein
VMWSGLHGHQIWAFVVSSFEDIWRKRCLNIALTPYPS